MTTPTHAEDLTVPVGGTTPALRDSLDARPSLQVSKTDAWLAVVMVVGLFVGLGIACWLLLSEGKLETDLGEATSKLLPFAVIWVGLIVGTNQLLKTTAATATKPHELAQATVYTATLAIWDRFWPTATTSISVGYFTAVLADQYPLVLISFIGILIVGVVVLSIATQRQLAKEAPLSAGGKRQANVALVVRPWLALAYLVPAFVIVALSWTQWH